jgi:transcriptional/translational regulatory protein YebC/TACO1
LGKNGSLSFVFERKGIFQITPENMDVEELELELIDAGAEEFELEDNLLHVTTAMEDFGNMMKKLDELNIEPELAELQRIPINTETISLEKAKTVMKMIDAFEEDDDVANVYHNLEMTSELEDALNEE